MKIFPLNKLLKSSLSTPSTTMQKDHKTLDFYCLLEWHFPLKLIDKLDRLYTVPWTKERYFSQPLFSIIEDCGIQYRTVFHECTPAELSAMHSTSTLLMSFRRIEGQPTGIVLVKPRDY